MWTTSGQGSRVVAPWSASEELLRKQTPPSGTVPASNVRAGKGSVY